MIVQEADIGMKQEVDTDLLVSPLARALLFVPPGNRHSVELIISSELTYEGNLKSPDEDSSSVLSIRAIASTNDDDEDADYKSGMEGKVSEDDCIEDDYGEEEEEEDCDELDELCSGMNRIYMEGEKSMEFGGKHT